MNACVSIFFFYSSITFCMCAFICLLLFSIRAMCRARGMTAATINSESSISYFTIFINVYLLFFSLSRVSVSLSTSLRVFVHRAWHKDQLCIKLKRWSILLFASVFVAVVVVVGIVVVLAFYRAVWPFCCYLLYFHAFYFDICTTAIAAI